MAIAACNIEKSQHTESNMYCCRCPLLSNMHISQATPYKLHNTFTYYLLQCCQITMHFLHRSAATALESGCLVKFSAIAVRSR